MNITVSESIWQVYLINMADKEGYNKETLKRDSEIESWGSSNEVLPFKIYYTVFTGETVASFSSH